jgi:hypothetical protein
MNIQCDRTLAKPSQSFDDNAPSEAYPSTSVEAYPSGSVDETPARPSRRFAAVKQRWPYVIIGISAASTLVWIGLLIRLAMTYAMELI